MKLTLFERRLVRLARVILGVGSVIARLACAQDASTNPPVPRLLLADAKRLAFERNWDLLAAKADVDIATAQGLVSREFPNPVVGLSVTKISTDGQPASTVLGNSFFHRSYDTVASFNQLIEIGGKRSARRTSAKAGVDGAVARFADAHRLLDLAVTRAFVASLLADEQMGVLRASAASLRREAGIAELRYKAGDISRADRDQIAISADRLELDASRAESDAHSARIQLQILLGTSEVKNDLALGGTLSELTREKMEQVEGPSSAVPDVADRPDVRAAAAAVRKADADLRLQKAQRVPDPTFLVQYEREPPDKNDTVGFGVSFPLPLWNWNKGNIAAAAAARAQAEGHVRQAEANARAEIATARHELATATERSQRYSTQIVPHSAEITQTVRFAYEKGGASLLDLLTAERNDNDVRLAAAAAAADAANATAALQAALGTFSPSKP